jgi:hypothetical protein
MFQQFTAGPSLADKVAQQLAEMTDRLCREFAPAGGAAAEVVRGQVTEVRAGFGSPKVLTYLPVLVERSVRHRLSAPPSAVPSEPT